MSDRIVPSGWAELKLNQVVVVSREKAFSDDAPNLLYIGLEHIQRDTHRIIAHGLASQAQSVKNRFRSGDLLYGRLRPNLNKAVIAPSHGICSTDLVVFRSTPLLDVRFLMEILGSPRFIQYAISKSKGVNLPRISIADILSYSALIPPHPEQLRIISQLESQYSAIYSAESTVEKTASAVPKISRQVIEAGVQGRLLKGWQRQERSRMTVVPIAVQSASDLVSFGTIEVPSEWDRSTVGAVGTVSAGRQRSPKNHYGDNMQPYLRVANVFENRISVEDVMTMHFEPKDFETYKLRYGDILLNEGQSLELVGRPAMYRDELNPVAFTNSLVRFQASEQVHPEYALFLFRYYLHSGVFRTIAKITTNLAHLGVSRFAALGFPLPPIDQQREIAATIARHLDHIRRIDSQVLQIKDMLAALRNALRREALSGRLVKQSDNESDVAEALGAYQALLIAQPKSSKPKQKPRKPTMKLQKSVLQALQELDEPITGQDLFFRCGYPEDASTEIIEHFFLNLRSCLSDGTVLRIEHRGDEMFALKKGKDT
jgi:type I restriction enzyme, S subunit